MPYPFNDDLPAPVRAHLPEPARNIFREAFNHTWLEYADDPRREEIVLLAALIQRKASRRNDGH